MRPSNDLGFFDFSSLFSSIGSGLAKAGSGLVKAAPALVTVAGKVAEIKMARDVNKAQIGLYKAQVDSVSPIDVRGPAVRDPYAPQYFPPQSSAVYPQTRPVQNASRYPYSQAPSITERLEKPLGGMPTYVWLGAGVLVALLLSRRD